MIRRSTPEDMDIVTELVSLCFGDTGNQEFGRDLDGNYFLYFLHDKLIALTGLLVDNDNPNCLWVSWSCTHPDFQKQGYMYELFKEMLSRVPNNKIIYCSCRRFLGCSLPNLHRIICTFGFAEVASAHKECKINSTCSQQNIQGCVGYKGNECACYEDLYMKKP